MEKVKITLTFDMNKPKDMELLKKLDMYRKIANETREVAVRILV